ncbi:MAG: RluA family pseudouridine synthase [Myxococcaceae bacterium]
MSPPDVLAAGPGWVAVDKPPGILVIPGRHDKDNLREMSEAVVKSPLWVVHRLDRDTSGVVLFATRAETHRFLSAAFEHGAVQKTYWALVRGDLAEPVVATFPLVPARRSRMRVAREGEAGKEAKTEFIPVERWGQATWVQAIPRTGRQHQIRVHLAALGHPLWVDPQYAANAIPVEPTSLTRTPLHAHRLTWTDEAGVTQTVASPLPDDISMALSTFRSLSGAGRSP